MEPEYRCILVEFIGGDIVDREYNLNALLLRLLDKTSNLLGSSCVEERVSNLGPQ